jgi:predicted nucleic acid-binding protein
LVDIVVPDLFWIEIGSFLWKASRRGKISVSMARSGLDLMLIRNFPTAPSATLLPEAMKIALDFDRTIYDSIYVALAVAKKTELLTADERLVNALGSRLPVRWLGAH